MKKDFESMDEILQVSYIKAINNMEISGQHNMLHTSIVKEESSWVITHIGTGTSVSIKDSRYKELLRILKEYFGIDRPFSAHRKQREASIWCFSLPNL